MIVPPLDSTPRRALFPQCPQRPTDLAAGATTSRVEAAAPLTAAAWGEGSAVPPPRVEVPPALLHRCATLDRADAQSTAVQVAALVDSRAVDESLDVTTDHALLVLLGKYAQHLGLIERLEGVPIDQRTREHTPQTKLIQFFVGILAGLDDLQDFNTAPRPLVQDQAVSASWLQDAFAHYSGVSRTLEAADEATVTAVIAVLQAVAQPFIDAEVLALVRQGQPVTVDVDLTGRKVSPTTTTYPDADFGWMDDAVAKGYQAAITTLSGGPCGRLVLSSQRYPGRTKSAECLQAAVRQMEQVLGLHPRRRTDLVRQRLATLTCQLHHQQTTLETTRQQQERLCAMLQQVQADLLCAADPPQPLSARLQQRAQQLRTRSERVETRLRQQAAKVAATQAQHTALTAWLAALEEENATLSSVLPVVLRVDAGFSTDDNLTWLIEMGYTVVSKAHSGHTTTRLRRTVAPTAQWTAVGGNAEALALPAQRVAACPYALEMLLVRYHLPSGPRYTTLLYYGDTPPPTHLPSWFRRYNARQIMEAGIKEQKGVFTMRRPLVRSRSG
jgi:hypothetical protein